MREPCQKTSFFFLQTLEPSFAIEVSNLQEPELNFAAGRVLLPDGVMTVANTLPSQIKPVESTAQNSAETVQTSSATPLLIPQSVPNLRAVLQEPIAVPQQQLLSLVASLPHASAHNDSGR